MADPHSPTSRRCMQGKAATTRMDLLAKGGRPGLPPVRCWCWTAAVVLATQPAHAQVAGGIDPQTALTNLETYGFSAAGAAISLICLFKGSHAVAEGRHLFPFVGGALGGIILAFGGPYILQHMGVG